MKTRHLQGKIGAILLGFSLLFGIALTSVTTVEAQYGRDDQYRRDDQNRRNRRNRRGRDQDGYGNYGGSFQLRQTALNAGFSEGAKEGRKDRQRGEQHEFRDESAYQKATKDYNSRLGDKEIYRMYFREAFEHGYADGYAGY